MLFRDEHVERRDNEQGEDRSNRHSANQHKTDGISRGRAGAGDQGERKVTGDGCDAGHHDRAQTNPGGLRDWPRVCPCLRRCNSLANCTIRIPFFETRPTSVTSPTWE